MKRLALIVSMLALAVSAIAAPVPVADCQFVWEPNPASDNVTQYRVYEKLDGEYILRATVDGATTQAVVTGVELDRPRVFVCRAFNYIESSDSNEAIVPAMPPPNAPAGMQFKVSVNVTVTVQ